LQPCDFLKLQALRLGQYDAIFFWHPL
jgi:hypothetical protein